MKKNKIIVTGGAGFIGSEFVRQVVDKGYEISVIDNLTYAGDLKRLESVKTKINFIKADISDKNRINAIFARIKPELVVHFAAESHVDRSIDDSTPFVKTNILGTQVLLDASKKLQVKKFVHISTDEVYGDTIKGSFTEESLLKPSSPYAASKAAADLLVKSYIRTFNFPAIIIRPCNNYGPWQFPEKLIPLTINRVLRNQKTPVYAKGLNVREWLYVRDCAQGIFFILIKGNLGEVYNIGSGQELKNIDVVKSIIMLLDKNNNLIEFVKDRPGHDIRYSLNSRKIRASLGWKSKTNFQDGLEKTVAWYVNNRSWKA